MWDLAPALRYAFRSLRRSPGFTITSIATLALGIAASSLIYCVVRGTLLRSLPFADPDRLVALWEHHPLLGKQEIAAADFRDWRERNRTFEELAAYTTASYFEPILSGCGAQSEKVGATLATRSLFPLLGVSPVLGRSFVEAEDEGGRNNVAIISNRLWHRCFQGERGVLEKTIRLNSEAYRIVGVLPHEAQRGLTPIGSHRLLLLTRIRESMWRESPPEQDVAVRVQRTSLRPVPERYNSGYWPKRLPMVRATALCSSSSSRHSW